MLFSIVNQLLVPNRFLERSSVSMTPPLPISLLPDLPLQPPLNSDFLFDRDLQKMTAGKQLLLDDLLFSIETIHSHYENGYIAYRKGIELVKKRQPCCVRCGNADLTWFAEFPCARCGQSCSYCRRCLLMGRVSTCTPLISWIGPSPNTRESMNAGSSSPMPSSLFDRNSERCSSPMPSLLFDSNSERCSSPIPSSLFDCNSERSSSPPPPPISRNSSTTTLPLLAWTGTLSDGQQHASVQVIDSIEQRKELLVWAVCGAGKTEILFAGIEQALKQGMRVCIATPRTDVVLELTPRLQSAFPAITVASLYGGTPDRHLHAPLTISTTHQLLRFYHAFEVVILDEVDAFPYSVDETLQYAVKQARKPGSALIYLTATPSQKWQRECRAGKRPFVTIPARFHRHPLPVPEFVWCGNWEKRVKSKALPPNVMEWITKRLTEQKQALLFLPRIALMDTILPLLRAKHPAIEAVHAEDPKRKEKVQRMRNGDVPLLITTTILERGVTFPNIDVAVLGTEDRIFTESALVQIAGRVGRSAAFPTGTITFFHYGKTEEMVKARQQIIKMNKEAGERGLIMID